MSISEDLARKLLDQQSELMLLRVQYHQLLMGVSHIPLGETAHTVAMRYIREADERADVGCSCGYIQINKGSSD